MTARPFRRSRRPSRAALVLLALTGLAGLSGCSDPHEELRAWMEEQRRVAKPQVSPLVAPRKFDPQPYAAFSQTEPFSSQKMQGALKQESRQPNSLLAAEMNRRREPLEAYPLDALTMVGSVVRGGRPHALLKADNLLYQVKVGDYLGQNYGRVTRITETEIALRELVPDTLGEIVERASTLTLQERAQEKR
ncbi:pilus assembly protein PilP [Sphaerotilus sp. FB-3]|uniref:pilus assembly protein PilP n=1 Tax=Sphaerotilus sp. FB-3 TaxID=2913396 RepID=UPI001B55B166|nr:pilus assembly protein PilP [Sphaerotilus sp. FB-3]MBP8175081.1 pilus assembly protein PilP [Sphaerotilus sp.]